MKRNEWLVYASVIPKKGPAAPAMGDACESTGRLLGTITEIAGDKITVEWHIGTGETWLRTHPLGMFNYARTRYDKFSD